MRFITSKRNAALGGWLNEPIDNMTSLPTLDVQLADPLLAASTHSRRNILISAATVLAALVPALGNYLGFDSQMNTANLLDNNSLRLDWQPTSVIFAEFNLPYFLVPLLTPFSSLYWDKITKTALTTKLDRFVADMDAHRAHVRDKILHEHLSEHDADEIAADLENHKSIAFVNTQKLLARRQSIARASFHPWVIVFATLTL